MAIVKQIAITVLVLCFILAGGVYAFPSLLESLARYNLDIAPLRQVAALNAAESATPGGAAAGAGRGGRQREALVITAPVSNGVINDRLTAVGNGRAAQSIAISPLVSGQIVEIPVASGDMIETGTIVAKLDSAGEELALERAKLVAEDQRVKTARFESLLSRGSITAVEVETARAALLTAELAVREAQLNLDRRNIRSPISGIVGIFSSSIGDYVTNQSTIVTIDDRRHIIVEYFVPEKFATVLEIGAPVKAYSIARPGEAFPGEIVAIDNRIDVASRTLKVRADIDNVADRLRAGMAFRVVMQFEGETFPAVDPLAIQWDSQGSYVWLVAEDGKAMRKDARIVQRNSEAVLVEADLRPGDLVVTEGVQNLRPGAVTRDVGQSNAKTGTGS